MAFVRKRYKNHKMIFFIKNTLNFNLNLINTVNTVKHCEQWG